MDELSRRAETLEWFRGKMHEKLAINARKGSWEKDHAWYLLARMIEEVGELEKAMAESKKQMSLLVDYKEEIIKECADVANYAMMIADNTRKK